MNDEPLPLQAEEQLADEVTQFLIGNLVDPVQLQQFLESHAAPAEAHTTDAFDRAFYERNGFTLPVALHYYQLSGLLGTESVLAVLQHFYGPRSPQDGWDIDVRHVAEGVRPQSLPQAQAFAHRLYVLLESARSGRYDAYWGALKQLDGLGRELRKVWVVEDAFAELFGTSLRDTLQSLSPTAELAQAVGHVLGDVVDTQPVPSPGSTPGTRSWRRCSTCTPPWVSCRCRAATRRTAATCGPTWRRRSSSSGAHPSRRSSLPARIRC